MVSCCFAFLPAPKIFLQGFRVGWGLRFTFFTVLFIKGSFFINSLLTIVCELRTFLCNLNLFRNFILSMKVLLTTLNSKYIHTNLAIRILYGLNKNHGGLSMKEFSIKEDPQLVADFCAGFDVVAFSCYIWNITPTLVVADKIKTLSPQTKILLGGPEVSYDYEQVIKQNSVDYIIPGEGEAPFAKFLIHYPLVENIPSLVYKLNNSVIVNSASPMFDLTHLENLLPYEHDDPEELKNKVLYIETSRGCPYKCEFCLASLDNKVRYLPNKHIKANLLYLMNHGRVIKFLDRTFNIKREFSLDIFDFILKNHKHGNVFQFEITADIVHPDLIEYIKEKVPTGLFRFEIGIQTVNQTANLEVSRKQDFNKTKEIIRSLQDHVEMHLDLIVGLPFDYLKDIKYSFEEVFGLFAPELQLGFLKFLKGTPVREKHQKHGYVFDPNPPYQIIKSDFLSEGELKKITELEHALEIYWNKKRCPRTLRYVHEKYSSFDFLSELGTYFVSVRPAHDYTLSDVYEIIYSFCEKQYPDDVFLKDLIVADYYLQYKIKPKILFRAEAPRETRNLIIQDQKLNHHSNRFIMVPVSFEYNSLEKSIISEEKKSWLIVVYSGSELPVAFSVANYS